MLYNRYIPENKGGRVHAKTATVPSDLWRATSRYLLPQRGRDVEPILLTLNEYEVIRLVAEAERTGSDTIRMTHEQIAQHISSAREAVARMLKSFSEDGLVELKRGAITLRDKNRLNRLK